MARTKAMNILIRLSRTPEEQEAIRKKRRERNKEWYERWSKKAQ